MPLPVAMRATELTEQDFDALYQRALAIQKEQVMEATDLTESHFLALRKTLGATIRERRKALRLTLAQLAARTGISVGYLSQVELAKNSASIETLYRISLGLGTKIALLFPDTEGV